jgi:hypothetical protein
MQNFEYDRLRFASYTSKFIHPTIMSTAQIPGRSPPSWSNQTHQLHDRKLVDLEVIQAAFEDMHVVTPQCKHNLKTTLAQMATARETTSSMTANRQCAGVARMQTMQTRRRMDITHSVC